MLIAVFACVLGIILENRKWPQDRSAIQTRFIESDEPAEKLSLLIGLVLNHSVVRWLIAFAVAAAVVLALLMIPSLQLAIKAALRRVVEDDDISRTLLDALIWFAISVLMTVLSITARRIAG